MLHFIRKKLIGIIGWVVVILIAIAFTFTGINYNTKDRSSVAMTINNKNIYWSTVNDIYQSVLREQMLYGTIDNSRINLNEVKEKVCFLLSNYLAIVSESEKLGYCVNNDDILTAIHNMPQFKENGLFSYDVYSNLLRKSANTESNFQNELKDKILLSYAQKAIEHSSFILDYEVKNIVDLIKQRRTIHYSLISNKKFNYNDSISLNEINDYYNKNKELFLGGEAIKVSYIMLSGDSVIQNIDTSKSNLRKFYNDNISSYIIPKKIRIKHIFVKKIDLKDNLKNNDSDAVNLESREKMVMCLNDIRKKKYSFDDAVKIYSEDKCSGLNDGDIGWIAKDSINDSLHSTAFNLKALGDISEILETDDGFHILQLIDKKNKVRPAFKDIYKKVYVDYRSEKLEEILLEAVDDLSKISFENSDSLDKASSILSLPIVKTDFFSKEYCCNFFKLKFISDIAFNKQFILGKKNSEVIKIDKDKYIVFRIDDYKPIVYKDISESKEDVIYKLNEDKSINEVRLLKGYILNKVNKNKDFSKIIIKNGLKWNIIEDLKRNEANLKNEILFLSFCISNYNKINKFNQCELFKLTNSDYALMLVSDIKDNLFANLYNKNKDQYCEYMSNKMGNLEYFLYQESLINKSKIKISKDITLN